ncbi:hypothetical protein, partial [Paragemmobacter ruber]|uniref:hypothetical protein n=1 Tax=Paragemmobacter ruber TaxID=1985673 RepID=UPI001F23AC81
QICFMASFLRTVSQVERFGILMDRHRWTDTPCGYKAARTITQVTCHGIFPPSAIRVRPMERTDDEEGTTDGRADHWHLAGA